MSEEKTKVEPGTLYLVSTPIGNLRDISLRALDVLSQVDLIAAEDTRNSRVLLNHYDIRTPVESHHAFNEKRSTPQLIRKLQKGLSIALISDAGTPGISDPAFYLVREAVRSGVSVQAVPGATAFVPALLLSGLPIDRFVFEGFLPAKKGRRTRLTELANEPRTMVLYEAPHRLMKCLQDLYDVLGDRPAAVIRELTKKFEQVFRGTLSQALETLPQWTLKGEFVVVVAGCSRLKDSKGRSDEQD